MLKGWSNVLTVACIVIAGVVEAGQQALKDAPKVAALAPDFIRGSFWNYVPLLFLIAAGVIWLLGRFGTAAKATETAAQNNKLVIHSAVYGTGPLDDVSVRQKLNNTIRDALVIPVDNNLIAGQPDPAPNQPKRIVVEYSYGNSNRRTVERPESRLGHPSRLVLPEDSRLLDLAENDGGPTPESLAAKEEKKLVDELNHMTANEMKQRYQADPDFVRRVNAIPRNKYRSLPEYPSEPDYYADTLEKRAFALAKQIRNFMKKHGPEPEIHKKPGEDNDSFLPRYRSIVRPWQDRIRAGYEAHLREPVRHIRDEFAERNLVDQELNEAIFEVLSYKVLETMATRIRLLASRLDD